MVVIDDAGTGSILGKPIVVGEKDGNIEYVEMKDLQGRKAIEEVFELLQKLGVKKDEEIKICRGFVFDKFCNKAKKEGYTNIERIVVEGELQDKAEDIFMNTLYELGVSKDVKLKNKNYVRLHEDLCNQLIINPNLMQFVRPHYTMNKHYTHLVYKIDRMNNEFPNLLKQLQSKKDGNR